MDLQEGPLLALPDRLNRFLLGEGRADWDGLRLPEALQAILLLARRLQAPEDVPRRLADNLRDEKVVGVRSQILATLARQFPNHPATREALLAAREDPAAEVRLRAGIGLGPEGRELLVHVAHGEGAEDETTERAVQALGLSLTADEAQSILRHALRTRREATVRACLRSLGQHHGIAVVSTLARVMAVEKPELAAVAAEALGATGDAAAEAPLVAVLDSPHAPVRVAAARALGSVGTAAAVPPLKEAEARDAAIRAAARQAVAQIQSRAPGAGPGQLSLADAEAGQLSLATGEAGQLSLAGAESRPLSLVGGTTDERTPSGRVAERE
jgi:HEAT repeat protein